MKHEHEENIIYPTPPLEALTNHYWRLQRLQEEGHNVTPLLEETWGRIKDIIESEEKVQLAGLRQEIGDLVKEEAKQAKEDDARK